MWILFDWLMVYQMGRILRFLLHQSDSEPSPVPQPTYSMSAYIQTNMRYLDRSMCAIYVHESFPIFMVMSHALIPCLLRPMFIKLIKSTSILTTLTFVMFDLPYDFPPYGIFLVSTNVIRLDGCKHRRPGFTRLVKSPGLVAKLVTDWNWLPPLNKNRYKTWFLLLDPFVLTHQEPHHIYHDKIYLKLFGVCILVELAVYNDIYSYILYQLFICIDTCLLLGAF